MSPLPARLHSRSLGLDCPEPASLDLETLRHWHQLGLEAWRTGLRERPGAHSWLDIKLELARRLLRVCNYCVHDCRVDRLAGQTGYCRLDAAPRISGSYLHWGEEAPISPTWAIFFSGCTMHCLYCHNWRETFDLSAGAVIEPADLANTLKAEQAHYRTISLIGGTPEPQLHAILELALSLDQAIIAPLVFNSNATLSPEGLALMEGVIDIYLPDYKHGNDSCAWQVTKLANYTAVLRANLDAYVAQGAAVLVRHLVLPEHLDCCTRPILETLAHDYPGVAVNVMFQYRPMYKAVDRPGFDRSLVMDEKDRVSAWVAELGLRTI